MVMQVETIGYSGGLGIKEELNRFWPYIEQSLRSSFRVQAVLFLHSALEILHLLFSS